MQRFWTLIQANVSLISISPTLGWKNVYGKCCWKVSRNITILTCHIGIGLTCTSGEIGGSDIGSTNLLTYPTMFKLVDVIKLIGWFDQTDVGTTIVPIENNLGSMANIKSFSSWDISKWKS
jgi:hypothetical protein